MEDDPNLTLPLYFLFHAVTTIPLRCDTDSNPSFSSPFSAELFRRAFPHLVRSTAAPRTLPRSVVVLVLWEHKTSEDQTSWAKKV
ncbi:hypothetical protein Ahy_B08g089763 isoform B [Arachis hypogaea]|uniref:Uncharacterized protein n=1 Tax=Arachis hypogaea TaxID=3818 RepID=A0A444XYR8_ARAHY|nr:hypothetical protein Ahy_B08g089763 isoform B [Arachis hypogaea]